LSERVGGSTRRRRDFDSETKSDIGRLTRLSQTEGKTGRGNILNLEGVDGEGRKE
jgi:hypothetical protein